MDVYQAFWVAMLSLHAAVPPVGIVWFHQRRQMAPIRFLRPQLLVLINAFLCALACVLSLTALFAGDLNILLIWLPSQILIDLTLISFALLTLSLALAYRRMMCQMRFAQDMTRCPIKNRAILHIIRLTTALMSTRTVYAIILANLAVMVGTSLILAAVAFPYMYDPNQTLLAGYISQDSAFVTFQVLFTVKALLEGTFLFVVSTRLRHIADVHGMKRLLKRVALVTFVSVIGWAVTAMKPWKSFEAGCFVLLLACDVIMIITMVAPLMKTYTVEYQRLTTESHVDSVTSEPAGGLLQGFLHSSPERFEAYKALLEKDMAVESIMFWKDACEYERTFAQDDASVMKAIAIYRSYLMPGAPMEINIDSVSIMKFREVVFPYKLHENLRSISPSDRTVNRAEITATLFRSAATQMIHLMEANSLPRFKIHQADMWNAFLAEVNAARVNVMLDTVSGTTAGMSISVRSMA